MKKLDINCDMGESFGAWKMGNDAQIMPFIDSANIACGFHAGDFSTMFTTTKLALDHGVNIGAHVGFDDKQGFGRRPIQMSAREIYELCVYQIGALQAVAHACQAGHRLHHIKPHGALYNMSANHADFSNAIIQAIRDTDPQIRLYALAGSLQVSLARQAGLIVYEEIFSDRTYQDNGTLTPRTEPNALIHDSQKAINQVCMIAQTGKLISTSGKEVQVNADTVCIHGDGDNALSFAQQLRAALS